MSLAPSQLRGPEAAPLSGRTRHLVVFLHGYGASGEDLIGLSEAFAERLPDARFLSPHAPFRCEMSPFGYQWFSLQDWSPAKLLEGAEAAAPVLNAYLDAVLAKHGLEDKDLALVGFSQGTMTALHAVLRRPQAVAGVLGYSGSLVGAERLAEEITARPPVCLVHGEEDTVVTFPAMAHAEKALKTAGVKVESHARPGLAHGIDPEGVGIGRGFLGRVLG